MSYERGKMAARRYLGIPDADEPYITPAMKAHNITHGTVMRADPRFKKDDLRGGEMAPGHHVQLVDHLAQQHIEHRDRQHADGWDFDPWYDTDLRIYGQPGDTIEHEVYRRVNEIEGAERRKKLLAGAGIGAGLLGGGALLAHHMGAF